MKADAYYYQLSGSCGEKDFHLQRTLDKDAVQVSFEEISLKLWRTLTPRENGFTEVISMQNTGNHDIRFDDIRMGYLFPLEDAELRAIPFTVQQDGQRHVYSAKTLRKGREIPIINNVFPDTDAPYYGNSVYSDPSRPEPEITESGLLRSEAWFWGTAQGGLLVAKYNNTDIEYATAEMIGSGKEQLRLGGASFCLYHEPQAATVLKAGESYSFGETYYLTVPDVQQAYAQYKSILNRKGHGLPASYCPNVHWNELYDVGWYHSDRNLLNRYYTLDALKHEAEKAKACSCDALYLDPGWEFAEGTTFFDHHRLGQEKDFVKMLKQTYGLELSIRIILRTYINYWPSELNALHDKDGIATASMTPKTIIPANQLLYEQCLCNPKFWNEKAKRADKLVEDGASFIMLDEMDWRGECFSDKHGHKVPATAVDHANAVCDLAKHLKNKHHITVEVHDPVWTWNSAVYTPVYWRQGFGEAGSYQENWGFEFMWECIDDLKTGKALSLYYYNLSCDIPLYLHINMSADNDQCLFFWWAASTVRHLGIGGANCHPSVVPPGKRFDFDPEKRFASYVACMKTYKRLKAYFQRGRFVGINEYAHLHTLDEAKGGVLNLFNCEEASKTVTVTIDADALHGTGLDVSGADSKWTSDGRLVVTAEIPPLSHRLVLIADAIQASEAV